MKRFDLLSLYAIFVALNINDAFNTTYLVLTQGCEVELNPVVHWLLKYYDTTLILWLWKFIILVFVALLTRIISSRPKYQPRWWHILLVADFLMVGVCIWGTYLVYTS